MNYIGNTMINLMFHLTGVDYQQGNSAFDISNQKKSLMIPGGRDS
jgi:hypothetical protein